MTIDQRDQQSEPELGQDLDEVRSAWSGMEQAEPPALLDQAVLNTARRELEAGRRRRPLRWMGAFATATVVVLAMTIVIQQDDQALAPALEETDGYKLDQAAPASPVTARKAADRGDSRQNARPLDAPAKETVALSVAEEMEGSSDELKREGERIPAAQAWIERLLLLSETQQEEKLAEEMAAFRKAYPDYPLPPELD